MEYVRIEDGKPPAQFAPENLRALYRKVSFPTTIPDRVLAKYDVYPLQIDPVPQCGPLQEARPDVPQLIGGAWRQSWTVVDLSPADTEAALAAQWTDIRTRRNGYLASSDWTQLLDAPMTPEKQAEWASYRQALRDITNAADPFAVEFPDPPE